ncbi:hypothetical protein N2152v2_009255 [Parachlorella kessleri]
MNRPPVAADKVPHGAMQDSGKVAAVAYSLLSKAAAMLCPDKPLRVILLGTNHFVLQPAACLSTASNWVTPLGAVPVDQQLNEELHVQGIPYDDRPHQQEHSIENQLPFLQYICGQQRVFNSSRAGQAPQPDLLVAPVSIGWLAGAEELERVAEAVAAMLSKEEPGSVILVATSDFTHAGPSSYKEPPAAGWMSLRDHAIWRDSPVLHAIEAGSAQAFINLCEAAGTSLCGRWPVAVLMRVAEKLHWDLQLLSYAPSDLYVQSQDINGFACFAVWG